MENNNSEKTWRLTPGQIDKIVSLSNKISLINDIFGFTFNSGMRQIVRFCKGMETVAVVSECRDTCVVEEDVCLNRIIVDDDFFKTLEDYFTEKRSRLESELAAVISGEGGER